MEKSKFERKFFHSNFFFHHNFFWRKIKFRQKKNFFLKKIFDEKKKFFFSKNLLFLFDIWNLRPRLPQKKCKFWKNIMFEKKVAFGRKRIGRVYAPSRSKIVIFTHPIFESDFDCLTGKNRLHANSLPSPIASDKNKNLLSKKNIFLRFFFQF